MVRMSSGKDSLKEQSSNGLTLVRCRTEPDSGTSCMVNGRKITGGLVEAIQEGKKVSEEKGGKAYFHNKSINIYWPLEKFIESCPKLSEEIEMEEKTEWLQISAILMVGIAFLLYLLTTF